MEPTLSPADRLEQVYRGFLTASNPSWTPAEVADLILSRVRGQVPAEDKRCCHDNSVARFSPYISLSLVGRITCSMTSQSFSPAMTSYSEEVLRVLFEDMDLMTHLVQHFQSEDQILSHLAAKSVSACVFYFLQTSRTISPGWRQTCEQAFNSPRPGTPLNACLWSVTEVFKNLLKGAHKEVFGDLLAAFDSSLGSLCSDLLPEDGGTRCLEVFTSSRLWGATLCLLLDLLEVLTASALICGSSLSLKSQRLTHIHSSALLKTISGSSEYFVRKRAVLLLKRTVLQKTGEDWASGDLLLVSGLQHFSSDTHRLAHNVLSALAAGWLETLHVESDSFFGGTRPGDQKPDCVMLRGVSLLLLKTTEVHIQSESPADQVYGYLQSLWSFLRRSRVQLSEVSHRCCWLSVLFAEQDDDMMEAAKASLMIFLHHRRRSGLDAPAELETACSSGINPHCVFLLLLQSVSFDHSILLDFLISTETCFLDYLVRYLKLLLADWSGFTATCRRIRDSDPHPSLQQDSCGAEASDLTSKAGSLQPRLVQYGSSEESDPEDMEVSQDERSSLRVKQETSGRQKQSQTSPAERTGLDLPPLAGPGSCEASARAVLCLTRLREVVTRLQVKNLFPYNPNSLLKLLAQVESCSQRPSHFEK